MICICDTCTRESVYGYLGTTELKLTHFSDVEKVEWKNAAAAKFSNEPAFILNEIPPCKHHEFR